MLDSRQQLNQQAARDLLADAEAEAFSALIAVICFVGEDILDDEGQPYEEEELRLMLPETFPIRDENLTRVCGILHAVSGEEFLNSPAIFERLVGAIVEGDIFGYEDAGETPSVPDAFWALYQAGLVVEDELTDELGPRVRQYLSNLADEEAEDQEALAAEIEAGNHDPEDLLPYIERVLVFRRAKLAKELKDLGCKPDWAADVDPELAESMAKAL